ncbi:MAG: DUF2118 domain-containing protein [Zestosphaera sp.]
MRLRGSRKSGEVVGGLGRSSDPYKQPDCHVKVGDTLKRVQCYELVEFMMRPEGRPDFTVCGSSGECVSVSVEDRLRVIEISGSEVMVDVEEGMCVKLGGRLGSIITGKGEVRSVRSDVSGMVVLVHEVPVSRPSTTLVFIKVGDCVER